MLSWSKVHFERINLRNNPIIIKEIAESKAMSIIVEHLIPGKLLDFGAGEEKNIKKLLPDMIIYSSYDIDRNTQQDFYDISEIKDSFENIIINDVIEHMEQEDLINTTKILNKLVKPGGRLIVKFPVINTIGGHFYNDMTHKLLCCYKDVLAIFRIAGFKDIATFHLYFEIRERNPIKLLLIKIFRKLFYLSFSHIEEPGNYLEVFEKINKK